MLSKIFINSWIDLSKDPRNCNLEHAICSWCVELHLDKFISSYVQKNVIEWVLEKNVVRFTLEIGRRLGFITSRSSLMNPFDRGISEFSTPEEFKQYVGKKLKNMQNQNEVTIILLIAFVLVGVGVLLYYLHQNSQLKEQLRSSREVASSPSLVREYILVLVISADRVDLIQELETKKQVTERNWGELYSATHFFWIGTNLEFSGSKILNYFSEECALEGADVSEYDVCLVRVHLVGMDVGFQPNALQIDRRDAFERLPQISRGVTVSPRLSSEAYAGKGFYNR